MINQIKEAIDKMNEIEIKKISFVFIQEAYDKIKKETFMF